MSVRPATYLVVLAVCCALSMGHPTPASGQPLGGAFVFAGSGTNLPLTRLLVEAFVRKHPGVKIEVPGSIGSTGGIRAVADGAITIALTSRPFRESEKGLGLTIAPYARTALVLAVHPSVPDDAISVSEFINIYRGTKTRWANGHAIINLTREPGDSTTDLLMQNVPGFKDAYLESFRVRRWTVFSSDADMNGTLVRTPDSIGPTDMGAIVAGRLPVKALKVDGVAPTPVNILNGRYKLVKTLCFAYRERDLPATARAFLEFVQSREGARVLGTHGYLTHE